MKKTELPLCVLLLLIAISLSACGEKPRDDSVEIAEMVSLTMTAISAGPAPQPTAAPADPLPLPKTEPARIQFEAGAASTRIQARLEPGGLHPYVLGAMAGQEIAIELQPGELGILSIWGADGSILVAESEQAGGFRGIAPASQDYYIDVISIAPDWFDYTLSIGISALSQSDPARQVFARIEPFPAASMQAIRNTGVPPMLPANFPVSADLPAVVPYPLRTETGIYELSLDYGEQCQGAGACHYGMLAGMQTTFSAPVGTSNYPFDSALAQPVTLDRGMTGYFVESACGANCGDAIIWWVHGGYQYALGLKAGQRDQVVALANAAINNSMP